MAKRKWYVITVGKDVGVFDTWLDVAPLVKGVPDAVYQGFTSEEEARLKFAEAYEKGNTRLVLERPRPAPARRRTEEAPFVAAKPDVDEPNVDIETPVVEPVVVAEPDEEKAGEEEEAAPDAPVRGVAPVVPEEPTVAEHAPVVEDAIVTIVADTPVPAADPVFEAGAVAVADADAAAEPAPEVNMEERAAKEEEPAAVVARPAVTASSSETDAADAVAADAALAQAFLATTEVPDVPHFEVALPAAPTPAVANVADVNTAEPEPEGAAVSERFKEADPVEEEAALAKAVAAIEEAPVAEAAPTAVAGAPIVVAEQEEEEQLPTATGRIVEPTPIAEQEREPEKEPEVAAGQPTPVEKEVAAEAAVVVAAATPAPDAAAVAEEKKDFPVDTSTAEVTSPAMHQSTRKKKTSIFGKLKKILHHENKKEKK